MSASVGRIRSGASVATRALGAGQTLVTSVLANGRFGIWPTKASRAGNVLRDSQWRALFTIAAGERT